MKRRGHNWSSIDFVYILMKAPAARSISDQRLSRPVRQTGAGRIVHRRAERRQTFVLLVKDYRGIYHAFENRLNVTLCNIRSCGRVAGLRTARTSGQSVAKSSMMLTLPRCREAMAFRKIVRKFLV